MKSFLLCSILLSLLGLVGCGDLLSKKVIKKELQSDRFRVDCELDVNAFTDILHRNIAADIRCLENNLELFIKVVKTDRPGVLSRDALEKFVIKNRPEIKPEMVRAMKAVFDLNFLVTGEDPEYISSSNIKKLVNFAILFNEKASLYYRTTFDNKAPGGWDDHQKHRSLISNGARVIIQSLQQILVTSRNGRVDKLNIFELLDNFTTEDNRDQIELGKKFLFVKKLLAGGSIEEITHIELVDLLLNLETLSLLALDGIRFKYLEINQASLLEMLKRDLDDLDRVIHRGSLNNRDAITLFTIDELLEGMKHFVDKNEFDVEKFDNIIREGKKILMGGNGVDVKGADLKKLVFHARTILKSGTVFHNIYNKFLIAMISPLPVTIDFNEYRHVYPNDQKELETFERIVKKYRFFKGEFESAYFITGIKRNPEAIFEIYVIEYALKLVMQIYGSPSPNQDNPFGHSLDQFQMRNLVKKFQKDLEALKLISPLWPTITADNTSLLGTLFQYQSDKNAVMDVNEATEFATSLLASLDASKKFMQYFRDQQCAFDEFNRVEPTCMRKNFFRGFCDGYRKYYPQLFSSLGTPTNCSDLPLTDFNVAFLERAIRSARPCMFYTDGNREEIWYNEADINTMLMVLIHAESTVLRWDVNNNNILDSEEVSRAYEIYSPALDGFLLSRPPIVKKFKRQIYQYLIKYEEVPDEKEFRSMWKFVRFLMSFNKASTASRKTIASVLMAIGEENKKLPGAPRIDCNLLRDPENLPSNPAGLPAVVDDRPDQSGILNGFLNHAD
jgi:hypothetical protein